MSVPNPKHRTASVRERATKGDKDSQPWGQVPDLSRAGRRPVPLASDADGCAGLSGRLDQCGLGDRRRARPCPTERHAASAEHLC